MPFRKLDDSFSFTLYENAASIPLKEWESITRRNTIFLEPAYLKIIERCGHTRLACRYVLVYNNQKPCGIIYFQVADFKAEVFGDLLSQKVNEAKSKRLSLFERYIDSNKNEVLMRLFTCGNNLISGEYGFLFDKKVKQEQAHHLLLQITDIVSKEEKLRGTISAILIKDFRHSLQPAELFEEEKYTEFFVEPNLVLTIPENIHSLDDYTALFSKKYRNRAKTIFKSFADIVVKELTLEEIKKHEKTIYSLYENIFDKAKFKLNKLPTDYFSCVKKVFDATFQVMAFFLNGQLVAFGSCFFMPDGSLEAHYIGFDYELNTRHNLYQNLLYTVINKAISNKCQRVNLGRTAAEIKTTVGAKPENLICLIKPQNTISKIIQKPFIAFLQPAEWIPRNPFKEEVTEQSEH